MKDFIQSLFKTTEERVKNPFVGSFLISWIVFNWKPILYLFLSKANIVDKINYIDINFSETSHLLWFPLATTIFYILVLPYISWGNEMLIEYSLQKRSQIFLNKKLRDIDIEDRLAIRNILLEQNKTEVKEKNRHNELIQDLENKNKSLIDQIQNDKAANSEFIENLRNELSLKDQLLRNEQSNSQRIINQFQTTIADLNAQLRDKPNATTTTTKKPNDNDFNYAKKVNVIEFEDGEKIFEVIRTNGTVQYLDYQSMLQLPEPRISSKIDHSKHTVKNFI